MPETPYVIDRASLVRAFPPEHEPPALLLDFTDWLDGRPWGSIGGFRLEGTLADDAPIIDGEPAPIADAQADLVRAPRPRRWIPAWLADPEPAS